MISKIKKEIQRNSHPDKAKIFLRFFKTGPGQYGEGDKFLGLTMPEQRAIAKKYIDISLNESEKLIQSPYHEHRMTGLIILTYKYLKADEKLKKEIYELYINNYNQINNWDLVDVTAPNIVGSYLLDKNKKILYDFATSNHLWKKRISIISTFTFIKNNQFKDTIKISEILLKDNHDLIHKAVGWMLREMGKRDEKELLNFLDKYHKTMPRTMLRYSLEKLTDEQRKYYMQK
jgi:3-methyladenine DNA glycosylase AlkD